MPCLCGLVPSVYVTIYRSNASKEGNQVADYFNRKGICYDDYDISSDALAFQKMQELSGQTEQPVVVVDDKVFVGFNPEQLDLVVPSRFA